MCDFLKIDLKTNILKISGLISHSLRKTVLFTALTSALFASTANAGWEKYPHLSGVYDQKVRGNIVARWLGVIQYGQPTNYTCGATTTAMQMMWETHKKGKALKYDPLGIHRYINTVGGEKSGLTTAELKAGQAKMISYINRTKHLGLKTSMREGKRKTIKGGVSSIANLMTWNFSPAILYGNVKIPGAGAGGHYYLATGFLNCPKGTCTKDYIGLFVNDSVYNSPAYSNSNPVKWQAVTPRKYINYQELEARWKPTGSRLPWLRQHLFLYNVTFGV